MPEDRRIFTDLTVYENLEVGTKAALDQGRAPWTLERLFSIFPNLAEMRGRRASQMSGGEQQMLTIARTLMGNPEAVLLDEPSEGLAPVIVEQMAEAVRRMKAEGIAVLLSEQNLAFASAVADRTYIIEKGAIRHEGPMSDIAGNPACARHIWRFSRNPATPKLVVRSLGLPLPRQKARADQVAAASGERTRMTPDIAVCLAILGVSVVLFAWDRIPADVVALGVMLAVIATGLLPADKAFAGFGSDTVMMILGLLIISAGLLQTGVVDIAGRYIFDFAGKNPAVFLPVIMVSVATVSAFMNNTAATAFFVPLVIGYAARIGESSSKFLLPLAFASILTSSVTPISTSTNLVVSDLLTRYQQAPMGMFEMAPVGIPIAIAGILYVWAIGVRLIPQRDDQKAEEKIGDRKYQADVLVVKGSPLIGKSLKEANITADGGLKAVKLIRDGETIRGDKKLADIELKSGDELFIEGQRADLLKIKDIEGLDFKADVHLADPDGEKKEATIVEGVLLPRSPLIGEA